MKITTQVSILALILILVASALLASGTVGIYGMVSKVVFEPNDQNPERIQIWGAFTLVEGGNGSGGGNVRRHRCDVRAHSPSDARRPAVHLRDSRAADGNGPVHRQGRHPALTIIKES